MMPLFLIPKNRDSIEKSPYSLFGMGLLGSPKAYLGTAVSRFPNLLLLQGPNTGNGHTSVILMIEAQGNHREYIGSSRTNSQFR
ncbi:hypothetical protein DP120_09705 [Planococcus halotolerans]|uniref:Uncharacterized protein n=1 Tax=Planococcus halotolerans TaxID=2233542 RepID=A0A365KX43_9BACL|nr:hypothetical protein DP120_09705 [Planococcus halotolerans]